ncbi:MAG: CAP domain-containing protein [Steroidobacteraceae bacterium]
MRGANERLVGAVATALLLLLLRPAPATANAITAVNTARSVYCGLSRATPPPLIESSKLDQVARLLAHGEPLERAEVRARYEALRSVSIRIAGAHGNAALERLLGQRFCGQIADPRLRQVGTYGRGDSGLWIVAAQPFTAPHLPDADAMRAVVLALTNEARAHARTCGSQRFRAAPPLSLTSSLTHAAREHSLDMVAHDFFSHTGSDGSTPGERATRAGYRWSMLGENIASGVTTPQQAVAGWLASPEHCANIMTAGFRAMGVAFAVDPADATVIVWTEDFGTPRWRAK